MDHNMHNVQICPFSLDPSHRGVESTSRKSVIFSVCHQPDPTYHILLGRTPWSQPTIDMCTVVRDRAHEFWSFLGFFFGIMTKLMGSWAQSFNSWALLLGRHWTHGLICSKSCKNLKSWAPSFLTIHEQWSDAPIWNIFIVYSGLAIKQQV